MIGMKDIIILMIYIYILEYEKVILSDSRYSAYIFIQILPVATSILASVESYGSRQRIGDRSVATGGGGGGQVPPQKKNHAYDIFYLLISRVLIICTPTKFMLMYSYKILGLFYCF